MLAKARENSSSSSLGGNVAVNNTIYVLAATSLPSYYICLRNVYRRFNTMWHLSIIIRSSCRIARKRFINVVNSYVTADLGVTNTTAAVSGGWRLSYAAHDIPSLLHRRFMSPHNAINGTTTMVMPPCSTHAGNMNNMLLPAPVGITATTGLSPPTITSMASFCTLQNVAVLPAMHCNCSAASIVLNRLH
ncbi:hypothetical protein PSPO01_15607 [Paraphaeosphaeria sporulosa]